MLNNFQITRVLREANLILKQEFNTEDIQSVDYNIRQYTREEFPEFKRDMIEAGSKLKLLLLEYQFDDKSLKELIRKEESQILVFKEDQGEIIPVLVYHDRGHRKMMEIGPEHNTSIPNTSKANWMRNASGEIITFVILSYRGLVSEFDPDHKIIRLHPVKDCFGY